MISTTLYFFNVSNVQPSRGSVRVMCFYVHVYTGVDYETVLIYTWHTISTILYYC